MTDIHKSLKDNGIINDVIFDFQPVLPLKITYTNNKSVELGNELNPAETEKLPTVEYQPESDKALHTLVLADPDAPSRDNPIRRCWRHWVVTDISGNHISSGKTVTSYNGPTPPKGSGLHRYVFLLFTQRERIGKPSDIHDDRGKWDVKDFAHKYGLTPIGANFFQAQNK